MTGTTIEVKVDEIDFNIDPNRKTFVITENGRTPALKVEYSDGEYHLFICYENSFYKTKHIYNSTILKYFKSNKVDKLLYIETITMSATDDSYVRLNDYSVVGPEESIYGVNDYVETTGMTTDIEGNPIVETIRTQLIGLKPGYVSEAIFYESAVGPTISGSEFNALRRKFNL